MSLCLSFHNIKRKAWVFYTSWVAKELPACVLDAGVLFVHIPKAAGISICNGLYGGEVGHKRAIDYKRAGGARFGELKKFSVVRNPYARLLSAYEFLRKGGMAKYKYDKCASSVVNGYPSFDDFVLNWLTKGNNLKDNVHFIPQVDFLFDAAGELLVDRYGKLEDLEVFISELNSDWGLNLRVEKLNVSGGGGGDILSVVKDRKVIDEINRLYRDDFKLLGYEMV